MTERASIRDRGWGGGCAVGDLDNDGDPDLYVTNFGANVLHVNQGDGTFRERSDLAGGEGSPSSSAASASVSRQARMTKDESYGSSGSWPSFGPDKLRLVPEILEAAHENGVIHRDVKPANIKIMPDGHFVVMRRIVLLAAKRPPHGPGRLRCGRVVRHRSFE